MARWLMVAFVAALMLFVQSQAFAERYRVRLPEGAPGSNAIIVADRFPDPHRASLVGANAVDGTSFAVGGARGSAGLGVMFGALGALVNSATVAHTNSERGARLGPFLQTDIKALTQQLAPPAQPNGAPAFEIVPMVTVKFRDDTHFTLDCYIFGYTPAGERWGRGNFVAYGVDEYDLGQQASVDAAAAALPACIQDVYSAFVAYVGFRGGEFTERARVQYPGQPPARLSFLRTNDGRQIIFNFNNLVRAVRTEKVEFVQDQ